MFYLFIQHVNVTWRQIDVRTCRLYRM